MAGCISVYSAEYIGDYGKEIEAGMRAAMPDIFTGYKCSNFDAVILTSNALDYTINRGEDYEDADILNRNLRA